MKTQATRKRNLSRNRSIGFHGDLFERTAQEADRLGVTTNAFVNTLLMIYFGDNTTAEIIKEEQPDLQENYRKRLAVKLFSDVSKKSDEVVE
jgi:hypothetical protein